jgi:Ca2+-binding EF-hand superfamily protein
MLGHLQIKKLIRRFEVSDTDYNGILERSDFERIAELTAELRGWSTDSPAYETLYGNLMGWWTGMQSAADVDQSNQVTLQEWLAYHDKLLSDPAVYQATIGAVVEFDMVVYDLDGDGALNLGDYTAFFKSLGLSTAMAAEAFARLDMNGDGLISHAELLQLVDEYFKSNDPQAAGNWMLGPF